jgi:hypothetical protein
MAGIKLGKLPDRTPVKLTFSASPDLKQALDDYAAVYAQRYQTEEPLEQLIPAMLSSFLESDREFRRLRHGQKKG